MMRKFSPSELSGETRAAIRACWRAAYNGRVDVRRLYVEAQSMVEAEWFNPNIREEFEMDTPPPNPLPTGGEGELQETKVCNQCREVQPLSEFKSRYGGRETVLCATCRARHRRVNKRRREAAGTTPSSPDTGTVQPPPKGEETEPAPAPVASPVAHQNGTALVKRLPAQLPTPSMVRLSFGQAEKLLNLVIGKTRIDEEGVRIEATALARFLPALLDGLIPEEVDGE